MFHYICLDNLDEHGLSKKLCYRFFLVRERKKRYNSAINFGISDVRNLGISYQFVVHPSLV